MRACVSLCVLAQHMPGHTAASSMEGLLRSIVYCKRGPDCSTACAVNMAVDATSSAQKQLTTQGVVHIGNLAIGAGEASFQRMVWQRDKLLLASAGFAGDWHEAVRD